MLKAIWIFLLGCFLILLSTIIVTGDTEVLGQTIVLGVFLAMTLYIAISGKKHVKEMDEKYPGWRADAYDNIPDSELSGDSERAYRESAELAGRMGFPNGTMSYYTYNGDTPIKVD